MLFGNRNSFGIEIRPLGPTWEVRYEPERAAWCSLLIWAGTVNLCRHSPRGAERFEDGLNIPLASVTDWLVRSWPSILFEERAREFATTDQLHEDLSRWAHAPPPAEFDEDAWLQLREQWWRSHFISAGSDGAILPGISFSRQDEKLVLDWHTPKSWQDDVTFLVPSGQERIQWGHAEDTLAAFVRHVAEWLRRDGLEHIYPWLHHPDPLREIPTQIVATLELYTGRSKEELFRLAGTTKESKLLSILGLPVGALDPAASPATQVLRDVPPHAPEAMREVLFRLEEKTRAAATSGTAIPRLRDVARDAQQAGESIEDAGYLAAAAIRKELGCDGKPIGETEELLPSLGIDASRPQLAVGTTRMAAGMRSNGSAAVIVLETPRTTVPWAVRFEHARALGHLLLDPLRGDSVGAASSPYSQATRRRRSGAFAAEFLLPRSAVFEATDGYLDRAADPSVFPALISRFGVGARTAAHHLWNLGMISSTDIRDELIESYGSPAMQ